MVTGIKVAIMLNDWYAAAVLTEDAQGVILAESSPDCFLKNLDLDAAYILFNPFIEDFRQECSEIGRLN